MKKFITALVLMLVASTVYGADTLHQYYGERGEVLPSVDQRIPMALECGIDNYYGSYEQNVALLDCIQGEVLGVTIPTVVALFETSLRSKVTSSATSMTLVKGTDKEGNSLSGTLGFVIDEGTTSEEFVICTASGTALTSCTRGVSVTDGQTAVSALQYEHRRGASVKISNFPQLAIISRALNGDEGIPNIIYYDTNLSFGSASSSAIVTKNYVDNVVNQGAATSSESIAGIARLATQLQMASSTVIDSDNPLVVQSKYATSSPDVRGLYVPVAETDGYLNQGWLDLSEVFAFTGTNTHTGEETFSATTTFSGLIIGDNVTSMVASTTITGYGTPQPVYIATSTASGAGAVLLADGDDEDTLEFAGFAVSSAVNGETVYVQTNGVVGGFTGLTAGGQYYVQDAVGTIGTTVGTSEVLVGTAISATELKIEYGHFEYISSDGDANGAFSYVVPALTKYIIATFCSSPAGGDAGYWGSMTITKTGHTSSGEMGYNSAGGTGTWSGDVFSGTGPPDDSDGDCGTNQNQAHFYR